MIIKELTPRIILDEIPDRGAEFIYLLSRPMSLIDLRYSPFLRIYTTPYIKRIIGESLNNPLVNDCIITLSVDRLGTTLKISEGSKLKVIVLPTESATQNVMFVFESDNGSRTLYTGHFTEYQSVLDNEHFIEMAKCKFDHLYVDKTLDGMDPMLDDNSIEKTCAAVREVIERHDGCKLRLMLDSIGYEDLLIELAKIYDKQIWLDRIRAEIIPIKYHHLFSGSETEAKMVVANLEPKTKTKLSHIERKFMREKCITVKFTKVECLWLSMLNDYKSNVYRGLCLIQYSPHPSPLDLFEFISSANAAEEHSI